VTHVCALHDEGKWTIAAVFANEHTSVLSCRALDRQSIKAALGLSFASMGRYTQKDRLDASERVISGRILELAAALVGSVCMTMAGADNVRVERVADKTPHRNRAPGELPPAGTVYAITGTVELDLRPRVREYLAGQRKGGGRPTVQFPVRGHWRQQACGPHHSLRRATWIAPFWKGPLEARALLRPLHSHR
jgi:hypothetical protein